MPESSLPGDEPEIRPEVVQAIFSAMADNDSDKLNDLLRSGVTTGEYLQAMNEYGESPATQSPSSEGAHVAPDNYQREFEAIKLLAGDRQLTDATGGPTVRRPHPGARAHSYATSTTRCPRSPGRVQPQKP